MSNQLNAETLQALKESGANLTSFNSVKEMTDNLEKDILSLTDGQKKLLNIKDLTKWEELDTMGYVALKERMGILKRSGISLRDVE
jgi:hypothetical protein